MIELGLHRIRALTRHLKPFKWAPIHVAGTNGKGSICAYISYLLQATGKVRCGRFTSPHLIDRWDCIQVDGKPVEEKLFKDVERLVDERDRRDKVGATEFEKLTATAFEIFEKELGGEDGKPGVGIVEVGLGGRLDATNIIENPLLTVISKIDLDHQGLLGNSLREIAREKAGILKPGVDVVVDSANERDVLREIKQVASSVGTGRVWGARGLPRIRQPYRQLWGSRAGEWKSFLEGTKARRPQRSNIGCAYEAVKIVCQKLDALKDVQPQSLVPLVMDMIMPGRQQIIDIGPLLEKGEKAPVTMLDGAHNAASALALRVRLEREYREVTSCAEELGYTEGLDERGIGLPVTWLLAFSEGKDVDGILDLILKHNDRVFMTEFGPVDGMPWVKPVPVAESINAAKRVTVINKLALAEGVPNVLEAIRKAARAAGDTPLIIAGSLYLVSDVLRLLRDIDTQSRV